MSATCAEANCSSPVVGRGLCNKHYRRTIAAGTRDQYLTKSDAVPLTQRFWSKVTKTSTCWLWEGHTTHDGYGQIVTGGRKERVHRVAYAWLVGPIEDGMVLDHLCRVRRCVNPDHLQPVTSRTNTLRGIGPSAIAARRTHCVNGHEFTPENTRVGPRGNRICRSCRRAIKRRSKAKHLGKAAS